MKKIRRSRRKYVIWTAAIILAALVVSFAGYKLLYKPPVPTTVDGKPVNLKPATTEDKAQADARKNEIVNGEAQVKNNPSGSTKQSAIIITEANDSGVRAYVTGVFEEGGTCTATATMGSQIITKTSEGFQNASYTQCAPISWSTPLGAGSWSVKVTYKSTTTESTQSKTIEVK